MFRAILAEKGYLKRRIGLEVPEFYLHPYSYQRMAEMLGEALVMDASFLIHAALHVLRSPVTTQYSQFAAQGSAASYRTCKS